MSPDRRKRVLLGALGVLALIVLLEFAGLLPRSGAGGPDEESDTSAKGLYLAQARLAAEERRLIQGAPAMRAQNERLRERWAMEREGLVAAPTPDLAGARFRDTVIDALADLRLAGLTATVRSADTVEGAPSVRALSLDVKFDARRHRDVYTAIERIESLPGVRTNVSSLRVEGPGRMQVASEAKVSLSVQALAIVGAEG